MPVPPEQEAQWRKDWESERAKGYKSFLWRGFLLLGVMPGALMALALGYVQPHVAGTNVGTLPWVVGLFVFICAIAMFKTYHWWHAAEKRYLARNGRTDS